MTPMETEKFLKALIGHNLNNPKDLVHIPVFLWGAMGVGKSSVVKKVADDLGISFEDLRLSQIDPVDMRGIPVVDKSSNRTSFSESPILPHLDTHGDKGILFLDEINAAPPSVMAAAYQLVLDRKVGSYTLPPGWIIVAAGNRAEDRGVTNRLPAPLANRFTHLEFDVAIADWTKWAAKNAIDPTIIAFLNFSADKLLDPPKKPCERGFPTPRSWEFVSNLRKMKIANYETTSGAVGEEAATALKSFEDYYTQIPNLDDILTADDPTTINLPDKLCARYAVTAAIAMKVNKVTIGNAIKYLRDNGEFISLMVEIVNGRDPEALENKVFLDWIAKDMSSDGDDF